MQLTKISLLSTYGKLIQRYSKNYVYPSQETLLKLLKQHYRTIISRRALNYHLADLRSSGLVRTIKRNCRDANGQIKQLTSATCLTIKGCQLLFKLGSSWALRHLKKLRIKFGFETETHSPLPASPYQNPRGKLPEKHTLPNGRVVKKVEPGEQRQWNDHTQPLLDIMQTDEYLDKYPKLRKSVERMTRRSNKNKDK